MPKTINFLFRLSLTPLRYLVPAWAVLALSLLFDTPFTLVLFLAAAALAMTGICHALRLDMELSFRRSVARRGLVCFVLLTCYTTLTAVLLAGPAWWLMRSGSLPAALSMSVAALVAMLVTWRWWPAFGLALLWDDAYADDEHGSWLLTGLRRCIAFAVHITGEQARIRYWLPASLALLLVVIGALGLAGLGGFLPAEFRVTSLTLYGLLLIPAASLVIINRTLRALFAQNLDPARSTLAEELVPVSEPLDEAADVTALPIADASSEALAEIGDIPPKERDATLIEAARSGNIDLALAALAQGASADAMPASGSRDRRSALSLAVTCSDLRLLRALIEKRVALNASGERPATLIIATRDSHEGRPDAVMTLLANGADPRHADSEGNTPLHHAVRCAEPTVAALLLDAGADVNALNRAGQAPLGIACANANWPLATFLLENGARVNADGAQPALSMAAAVDEDDASGVKLLLRHKARIDARDALQRTALHAAALAGHAGIVETLLGAGADPDPADHQQTMPLMEAARAGAVGVIEALGQRRIDCDARDAQGRTALLIACISNRSSEAAARALLDLGASRGVADNDGRRALDHAAAAGRWHVVALLDPEHPLPSGFEHDALPLESMSADHLLDALRFGHWNIVEDFTEPVRDWPASVLAGIYRALPEAGHQHARNWLLDHGLDARDAVLDGGLSLGDALLEDLPDSHAALSDLAVRGAAIGGAGCVASILALAATLDDPSVLRGLATDLFARGADGGGALHAALATHADDLACELLARGADPNTRDTHGRTPLHLALERDLVHALPLLKALLLRGADPEIANASGETALGFALTRRDRELALWMDWRGWRLPQRPLRGSDLADAADTGDKTAIERLLALGLSVEAEDARGATALIRAAGAGHVGVIRTLIEAGADCAHMTQSGVTALAAAVSSQREDAIATLLASGVAADQAIRGGATPLMIAAGLGFNDIARTLLDAGANVNAVDDQGTTPLHAAARFAFTSRDTDTATALLQMLLDAGAQLETPNVVGQNALLLLLGAADVPGTSCEGRHIAALVDTLLARAASHDVSDQRGVGPLHACAMHGLLGATRTLKAAGADAEAVDGLGRTPAEVATRLGYVDVATELGAGRPRMPSVRQTLRQRASE